MEKQSKFKFQMYVITEEVVHDTSAWLKLMNLGHSSLQFLGNEVLQC
ncbi:hypothetical protein S1OALGB6SA_688 [Olavius algarvensis spirochete endosymbiont]|nr:hypothetical protein S1OALGB6SA_688 [Olavius algarvensis spirochete endosymbiont]